MRAWARRRAILLATRWRLPPRARPPVHLFSSPPLSSRTSISTCTISFPFPFAARSRITFTSSPLFSVSCILVRLCNPLPPRAPRAPVRPFAPLMRLRAVPCRVILIFSSISWRCSISCFCFRFLIFRFLFCVPPTHRATFPAITRPQIAPVSPPPSLPPSLPSFLPCRFRFCCC